MYEAENIENPPIVVCINPADRQRRLEEEYRLKGIAVVEQSNQVYCPISLTSTPDALKPEINRRQQWLMSILRESGLTPYDPGSAPFSPDAGLSVGPERIYQEDSFRVGFARYVVGWDLLPSTGMGVEIEQATTLGKIVIIIHDPNVRTSRMQPMRAIHISVSDMISQSDRVKEFVMELQNWGTGLGFEVREDGTKVPCLLGFRNGMAVNLQRYMDEMFPDLKYAFDGLVNILKMECMNPENLIEP